jgi:hypothetical protein
MKCIFFRNRHVYTGITSNAFNNFTLFLFFPYMKGKKYYNHVIPYPTLFRPQGRKTKERKGR